MNSDNLKTVVAAASLFISAGAFAFSMNQVSEEGAIRLENRMTLVESRVSSNEAKLKSIGNDTTEILSILRGRSQFMKEAGDIVDYMCERTEGCTNRYDPLAMPD